jgi:hypothetical protein
MEFPGIWQVLPRKPFFHDFGQLIGLQSDPELELQ